MKDFGHPEPETLWTLPSGNVVRVLPSLQRANVLVVYVNNTHGPMDSDVLSLTIDFFAKFATPLRT